MSTAGEITDEAGGPCITCKFHNSKFSLETGKAVQWTTGVMGVENAFIGNIMGKVRRESENLMAEGLVFVRHHCRMAQATDAGKVAAAAIAVRGRLAPPADAAGGNRRDDTNPRQPECGTVTAILVRRPCAVSLMLTGVHRVLGLRLGRGVGSVCAAVRSRGWVLNVLCRSGEPPTRRQRCMTWPSRMATSLLTRPRPARAVCRLPKSFGINRKCNGKCRWLQWGSWDQWVLQWSLGSTGNAKCH